MPADATLPLAGNAQRTGAELHADEVAPSTNNNPSVNMAASLLIAASSKLATDNQTDQASLCLPAMTETGAAASDQAFARAAAIATAEAAAKEEQLPAQLPCFQQNTVAEPPADPDLVSAPAKDNTGSTDVTSLHCIENLSQYLADPKDTGVASSKNQGVVSTAAVVAEPAISASAHAMDVSQADPPATAPPVITAMPAQQPAQAECSAVHPPLPSAADASPLQPQAAAADRAEPSEGLPAEDAHPCSAIGNALPGNPSLATQASASMLDHTPEPAQAPSRAPSHGQQASAPSCSQTGKPEHDAQGSALPSDHTKEPVAASAGRLITDHQASAPSASQTEKLDVIMQASGPFPGEDKLPAVQPTAVHTTQQASAASPDETMVPAGQPTRLPAGSLSLPRVFLPPWTAPLPTMSTATHATATSDTDAIMTLVNQQPKAGKPSADSNQQPKAGKPSADSRPPTAPDTAAARPQPKRVTRARQSTTSKAKSGSVTAARVAGRAGASGPAASETTQTTPGKVRGRELVGQRIELWWSGENDFFPGTVKAFTSKVR